MSYTSIFSKHDLAALDEALLETVRAIQNPRYRDWVLAGMNHKVELTTVRLLRIVEGSDRPSVREVAEHLSIAPSTASRLVDRAVESGYLSRTRVDADRRQLELGLTEKGQLVLKEINAKRQEVLAQVTREWPEHDFRAFGRLLTVFHTRLAEAFESPQGAVSVPS